ncbi:MAG: O-antigen/teichoic acid export membrane protein [Polaribacter sp.]
MLNTDRLNSPFFKNLTNLSIVEFINIAVPFIILPYLLRVIGKEYYGLVIFAQAVISYFLILQNFGINTYAVKEVSLIKNNKRKLNSLVSNVFVFKIALFFFSFLLLFLLVSVFPYFKEIKLLLFLTMWICFFDVIFPKWYFQGLERMKYITYVFVVSKLGSLFLIIFFVKEPNDYILIPIIYGVSSIIAGLGSLVILFKIDRVNFLFPKISDLKILMQRSNTFFISEAAVAVFANSNKVIIGSVLGMNELAYYDLADKIVSVFKHVPLNIVRNSIYPRVVITKNMNIVKNTTLIMGAYSIIVIVFIMIFASSIVNIIGGIEMSNSSNILKLFSISIFTTHISNYYITIGLWSFGYEKVFKNLMIYSTLVFLALFVLIWQLKMINIYSITILPIIVDVYLIFHTYYIYKQKKLF